MSCKATAWTYSPKVLERKLSANELAFLRAICWSINSKTHHTKPLKADELTRLTGIRSHQTLFSIRKRLNELGLISFIHANTLPKEEGQAHLTTIAYVYAITQGNT